MIRIIASRLQKQQNAETVSVSAFQSNAQALGRLPWLALFLRRARRFRPVLPIGITSVSAVLL